MLALADGHGTSEVARWVGLARPTVIQCRDRFAEGLAHLEDASRSGHPTAVDGGAISADEKSQLQA